MLQVAVVKWIDSTTFGDWQHATFVDESPLKVCYAAGLLVTDSESKTSIALLCADDRGTFSNWVNIPIANVVAKIIVAQLDTKTGEVYVTGDSTSYSL